MKYALAIMYHDVVDADFESSGFPGAAAARYKLLRKEFAEHLRQINERIPSPPITLIDRSGINQTIPLLLTIDDGGISALYVADQLERRDWRGHFFITTDYIDTDRFVTAAKIRELHKRGHVVGSHSCSHPSRMSELPQARLDSEWADSAKRLADILGAPTRVASVPGGFYARRVAQAAARSGIATLFTSEPTTKVEQIAGCEVIGRFCVYRGMSPKSAAALAAGNWFATRQQKALWEIKKFFKYAAKPAWDYSHKLIFRQSQ